MPNTIPLETIRAAERWAKRRDVEVLVIRYRDGKLMTGGADYSQAHEALEKTPGIVAYVNNHREWWTAPGWQLEQKQMLLF